jgi:ABC-type molybdenum transport system ATPase subunit/photorepair protein PhrA
MLGARKASEWVHGARVNVVVVNTLPPCREVHHDEVRALLSRLGVAALSEAAFRLLSLERRRLLVVARMMHDMCIDRAE